MYYGRLSDGDNVLDYLLEQHDAMSRWNPAILSDSDTKQTVCMRVYACGSHTSCKWKIEHLLQAWHMHGHGTFAIDAPQASCSMDWH